MQIVDYKISKEFLKKILVDNKKIIALFHANWSSSSNLMKKNFLKEEEDSYKNIKKIPYFNRSSKGFKIYYKKGFIREYILFGE